MKKFLELIFNHERYQTIAVIIAGLLLLYFYGCAPKCISILNPPQRITRPQLEIEIDTFIARANIGYATIEQQEEFRDLLWQQSLTYATTGAINPLALLQSLGAIWGIGATVDNVRKRKEIKRLTT